MLAKALLVFVYFLLVFLVAKVLDLSSNWLELGCVASPLFNPFALSVRRLRSLLDERGISYAGVVDKSELAHLVKESGSFSSEEICSEVVENRDDEVDEEITHFKSSSHLFEQIEDTKASGWLVQIIPHYKTPLLRQKQWSKLSRKITRFGIRTGVFDCNLEPRLCAENGWDMKCLLLSSPRGAQAKGNVVINVYNSKPSVERVFSWMNSVLAKRVKKLHSSMEYRDFISMNNVAHGDTKMVLFGRLDDPPALLSTLSIKFTGRVQFAYFKTTKHNWDEIKKDIGIYNLPKLLVVTPERKFFYGIRKGELLHYKAMEMFLTNFHPEANDLFLLSIILVNQVCLLELFVTPGGILRKTVKFILLISFANTTLMITWLPLVGMFKLSLVQPLLNVGLKVCRFISGTDLISLVRYHFLTYSRSPLWFLMSFCIYGFCVSCVRKRFKFVTWSDEEEDTPDWVYQDLAHFQRFFQSIRSTPSLSNGRIYEDNFDIFIQRLATPDLWLRPLMPTDFVKDLPVWKNCDCVSSIKEQLTEKSRKKILPYICDPNLCKWNCQPAKTIQGKECVICLEVYLKDCILVGLPCHHVFHQICLEKWFNSGSQHKNLNCPVCRWPAYKTKPEIQERSEHNWEIDGSEILS